MSTMNDHVCHAHAITRQDRQIKLTNFTQELDTLLGSACNILHDQLDYRKICVGWVSKNLTDDHKAHNIGLPLMHLTRYASHGEQFLQCIVTDKTFANHMTLRTSITSLM